MQWHAERQKPEEDPEMGYMLTHPSDAGQWEALDIAFPRFGGDARNIRLGMSTDGLNPFGNQSSTHSTWPVFVWPYNLPPWLCTKQRQLGPTFLHNMMPFERQNGVMKGYVRNRARPDASMAKGFLTYECISFCQNYLSTEDDQDHVGLPTRMHLGRLMRVVDFMSFRSTRVRWEPQEEGKRRPDVPVTRTRAPERARRRHGHAQSASSPANSVDPSPCLQRQALHDATVNAQTRPLARGNAVRHAHADDVRHGTGRFRHELVLACASFSTPSSAASPPGQRLSACVIASAPEPL
ncbi:hypothetical protein QYE76_016536 [Lolium multiflorum]|uniref:Uncharacterized protein n=1 Tax=Lolium multiflorum TaxID=4521 RepID=A0AAD8PGX9_LOLMU|nr:hypothetical protein QYE76_016536 [Lolium multiflorum]